MKRYPLNLVEFIEVDLKNDSTVGVYKNRFLFTNLSKLPTVSYSK